MRLIPLLFAMLIPLSVQAEEKNIVVVNNGIICDSANDVAELIQSIVNGNNRYTAAAAIPGCGMVVRPFPAVLSTVSYFMTNGYKIPIVKFEALEGFTQYSFGKGEQENSTI